MRDLANHQSPTLQRRENQNGIVTPVVISGGRSQPFPNSDPIPEAKDAQRADEKELVGVAQWGGANLLSISQTGPGRKGLVKTPEEEFVQTARPRQRAPVFRE